jgi:O-antigen ligase
MIRHADRAVTALLALLLLWAPLPFGSVTPRGAAGLEVGAFLVLALALALVGAARARGEEAPPGAAAALAPVALPLASLLAVALWGVLQSLPSPAALLAGVSGEHARLFAGAADLLAARPAAFLPPAPAVRPSLSLAASESLAAALAWAAAAAALAAAALLARERWNRRLLGGALGAAAAFQVFFGARNWTARQTVLWGVEVPGTPRLRGSFVNPDHLALYLGMALPAAFAWAWWAARRARSEPSVERRVLWLAPPILLWLTLFAGLAFTGSRAGLVAGVAAVALQGLLLATADRRPDLALAGAAAAVLGVGVVAAIGLQEGLGRLLSTPVDLTWGARRTAWAATWALFRRFPWTGAGLGAFREAFPLVQPPELAGTWRHAHNDPLELLATAGLLGTALALPGLLVLGRRLARVLRDGRRSEDRAAGLAALGALGAMAIHELLDFGLTIPANAFTLAVLVGAAASARTGGAGAAGRRGGEPHRAGGDGAAADALELEPVEPRRDGGGERHRPAGKRRR